MTCRDATAARARICGAAVAPPRAAQATAIGAAADFAAFYDHTAPMMSDAGTLLVITVDGKDGLLALRKVSDPQVGARSPLELSSRIPAHCAGDLGISRTWWCSRGPTRFRGRFLHA